MHIDDITENQKKKREGRGQLQRCSAFEKSDEKDIVWKSAYKAKIMPVSLH